MIVDCTECSMMSILEMIVVNGVIIMITFLGGVFIRGFFTPPGIEGRLTDQQVVGIIYNRHKYRLQEIRERFNELHPLDTPTDLLKEKSDEAKENQKFKKFKSSVNEYFGVHDIGDDHP